VKEYKVIVLGELGFRPGGMLGTTMTTGDDRPLTSPVYSIYIMSHPVIDDQTGHGDQTTTPNDAISSSSTTGRALTRGKYTFYGDGIIEYEYKPRRSKVRRVCGILGKDKRVSQPLEDYTEIKWGLKLII
jgi:hypothetical protein